jgi:hypothetical protein
MRNARTMLMTKPSTRQQKRRSSRMTSQALFVFGMFDVRDAIVRAASKTIWEHRRHNLPPSANSLAGSAKHTPIDRG